MCLLTLQLEVLTRYEEEYGYITTRTALQSHSLVFFLSLAQDWSMSLQKTGKTAYTCKIERYIHTSYLSS